SRRELSGGAHVVAVDKYLRARRRDLEAHATEIRLVKLTARRLWSFACVWFDRHRWRYRVARDGGRVRVRIGIGVRIVVGVGPRDRIPCPQSEAEIEVRMERVVRPEVVERGQIPIVPDPAPFSAL